MTTDSLDRPQTSRASLALGYAGFLALGLPDGSLGVAWPFMRAGFAVPTERLGLVLIVAAAGFFLSGLAAGGLLLRHGAGRVLAGGFLLSAAGLAAEAAAARFAWLLPGALLTGMGAGIVDSALNLAAAIRFSPRHVNWLHGCWNLGAMCGPLLLTAIIAAGLSWRLGIGTLAAVALCVAAAFAATASRWRVGRVDDAGRARAGWGEALRSRPVRIQLVLFFCYSGVEISLGVWAFTLLRDRGVGVGVAGVATSLYWASGALGRILSGAVIGRVGADRMVRGATLVATASVIGFVLAPTVLAVACLLLAGLALSPVFPTLMSRAPERLGARLTARAVGMKVSAATLGAAAVPALAGVVGGIMGPIGIGATIIVAVVGVLGAHERLIK